MVVKENSMLKLKHIYSLTFIDKPIDMEQEQRK